MKLSVLLTTVLPARRTVGLFLLWCLLAASAAWAQAPTISSLSPTSGPAGTVVTVTGSNLTNVRSVVLRGIPCNITPISATSASFVVPAQASTGPVRLTTTGGNALSGTFTVTRVSASLTYVLRSSSFNGINVSSFSTPAFTDLDHDGLIDMLVGRETGEVSHYEQTAANSTSFILRATNLSGVGGHYNAIVSVTDIDGDGLLEMVVGNGGGNFKHYEQTAANSTSFTQLSNDFNNIHATAGLTYESPHFTDIDGDGLLDLLVGDEFLSRYEQTTANGGTFTQLNNQNFGPTADASNGGSEVCVIDLDGDNRLDILIARNNGQLFHYEQNSVNGTAFTQVSTAFSGINASGYPAPAITDLDGDGLLDLILGGFDGTLRHYEQAGTPAITSFTPTSGPVGQSVTITGTNLDGATAVTVNGTAGTITGTPTATSLTFTVGAGSTTGAVSVTTPGGTATGTSFTVTSPAITITALSPTRNLRNAARTSSVGVTFSSTMSSTAGTLGAVKVFSQQRGGRMQNGARGATTQSGSTLTFNPTNDFKPGETLLVTTTTAATSSGGGTLAAGKVHQFTAATGGIGTGTFTGTQNVSVGTGPRDVALGDVDGDGDLDLVAANFGVGGNGHTVSVRLNNGSGVFSGTTEVTVSPVEVVQVALADVDGDGDLDLLATTANNNLVAVRLNNGSGTFSGGSDVAVGTATGLAVGDLDGDGDLDLAATNQGGTVGVRFNNGSGVFSGGSDVAVSGNPYNVELGDIDNDGDLDMLTANTFGNNVSIRLNDGSGTFSGSTNLTLGTRPWDVALGDLDGDGDLDLAAANQGGTVSVRLNNGSGTFSGGSDYSLDGGTGLTLGDLDADGDLDLLAVSNGNAKVSVALNNGSGTFSYSASSFAAVGIGPFEVAVGDLDGDGDLDLVTPNTDDNAVSIRFNVPALPTITSFTPTSGPVGTSVTITGTNLADVTAVTVNGTAGTITGTPTATSLTFTVGAGSTTGTVSVTAPGGSATSTGTFTVTAPPSVSSVTAPANATYGIGQQLNFSVNFDQAVTVNTGGGTPTIALTVGGTARNVTYVSGSGTATLVFRYTVPTGDVDNNGVALGSSISLNGGTIRNASSLNANLTLNNVGSTTNVRVDGVAPVPTISSTAGASGSSTATSPIPFSISFSENVSGLLIGDITVTNGTKSALSGSGAGPYTFTVTPTAPGAVTVNIAAGVATDAGSNGNTAATQFSITYAPVTTAAPTVTNPTNGSSDTDTTPTYSGTAPNGSTVTVYVNGVSIGTVAANGAGNWSKTQSPALADGTYTVYATAQTTGQLVSANSNTNTFTIDNVDPTVSISSSAGANGSTTSTNPIPFTVTFSENVSGLVISDITVSGGTKSALTTVSGSQYTFTVTPGGAGLITVNIVANRADDAAGNGNTAATQFSITYAPAPTLSNVSPSTELPGMPVVITGTGFTAASTVTFGGVAASSVTYTSATSLTATVPAGAAVGSSTVVVTTGGASSSSSPAFSVLKVYDAVASCLTTTSYTATGDGAWHYLLAGNGQVVAALQDTRAALGNVSVQFLIAGSASAVRQDAKAHRYLDRNWHLVATNPTFSGGSLNVRFYGLTSEMTRLVAADASVSYATLKATQYSGANEDCQLANNSATGEHRTLNLTASTPGNGVAWFVAQAAVTDHFSEFYLTGSATPLPVELVAFTAAQQGEAVRLAWATASEKTSAYFDIERSTDGREFAKIGRLAAQGSTIRPTDYVFLDNQVPKSLNPQAPVYYRLQQVDQDGSASYSPVRSLLIGGKGHLTLFPNPTAGGATLIGTAPGMLVRVFDSLGREVSTATADAAGTAALALPAGLPTGVYVVRAGATAIRLVRE